MKKLFRLLPVVALILSSILQINAYEQSNSSELKKFIVTAYYSPLPNQKFYLRWNFEDEVRLNWEWIRWASWKGVYPWMLAAPKTYAFGTKIFFDWIWIGTVDDRWWAIVSSWSRGYDADRIDIWMWYWDDWLRRALTWGKRAIYWRVISKDAEEMLPSLELSDFKIWNIDFTNLKNASYVWKNTWPKEDIVPGSLSKNSSSQDIILWKTILTKLWYYTSEIDWKYTNEIYKAILAYQLDNKIVTKKDAFWAGYYWKTTKMHLWNKYSSYLAQEKLKTEESAKIDSQLNKLALSFWRPKDSEIWQHVRKLQRTLKALGYFNYKDTAIFWKQTKDSLIKYQIDKWLVRNSEDLWAWMIWEKTLWKIMEDMKQIAKKDKSIFEFLDI